MNGLKDGTTDETVIRRWWMRWPDANIGILTGNGIVVLDIDPRHDGDASLRELEERYGEIRTLTADTGGGGNHYVFATHASIGNAAGILPGIDVRGEGGYIVAAPSLHPSGRRWEWRRDVMTIAPAPGWLLELIASTRQREARARIGEEGERIPDGYRFYSIYSLACALRRRGFDRDEILTTLQLINARRCDPPLSAAEVTYYAEKAAAYAPGAMRRTGFANGEAQA